MFDRTIALIGQDNLDKIESKHILIIGVGGVGGYAIEALIRSGIHNITLVDYDNIDISNINFSQIEFAEEDFATMLNVTDIETLLKIF